MTHEIDLGGTIYISSRRAAEITGYAQDYIGQLARAAQIDARRIAGLWYVREQSLRDHKEKADEYKPVPPDNRQASNDMEASVSFDGKDYISAARAARITGYSQDYVGQLARSEKILSRQIGNRWYVDRAGIIEHKRHNDSLLAAVQTESVGLMKSQSSPAEIDLSATNSAEPHFSYTAQEIAPMPIFEPRKEIPQESEIEHALTNAQEEILEPVKEDEKQIPIRVIATPQKPFVPEPHAVLQTSLQSYASTPRMVMYLIVFLGVAGSAFASLMYIDFPKSMSNQNDLVKANQQGALAVEGVSTDVTTSISRFASTVFSKEIHYSRRK